MLGEPGRAQPGADGLIAWDDIKAASAARTGWAQAHKIRAGVLRAVRSPRRTWWRLRRSHPVKEVCWRWQRSRRGWSVYDTWSLDSYIAGVLSGALHRLASGHSYPGDGTEWDTPEKWMEYLHSLSARLGAWNDETWTDDAAFETTRAAMEEFGRNFGHFWD